MIREENDEFKRFLEISNLILRKVNVVPEVNIVRLNILEVMIIAMYDLLITPKSLLYLNARKSEAAVANPRRGT